MTPDCEIFLAAMNKNRSLAHFIDLRAVFRRTGLAVEIIHEDRLPVRLAQFQHQGGLVAVARFSEAIELVGPHDGSSLINVQRPDNDGNEGAEQASHVAFEGRLLRGPLLV